MDIEDIESAIIAGTAEPEINADVINRLQERGWEFAYGAPCLFESKAYYPYNKNTRAVDMNSEIETPSRVYVLRTGDPRQNIVPVVGWKK